MIRNRRRIQIGAKLVTRDARSRLNLGDPLGGDAAPTLVQPVADEGLARANGLREPGLGLGFLNGAGEGFVFRAHAQCHKQTDLFSQAKNKRSCEDGL